RRSHRPVTSHHYYADGALGLRRGTWGLELTDHSGTVLLVVFILELKHFVFDYPLQRPYQFLNKGTYGHPGGILSSMRRYIRTRRTFITPMATA
ncbi:MAG: hypothetical protein ABI835_12190, partial [Chloroflexota bacterium]